VCVCVCVVCVCVCGVCGVCVCVVCVCVCGVCVCVVCVCCVCVWCVCVCVCVSGCVCGVCVCVCVWCVCVCVMCVLLYVCLQTFWIIFLLFPPPFRLFKKSRFFSFPFQHNSILTFPNCFCHKYRSRSAIRSVLHFLTFPALKFCRPAARFYISSPTMLFVILSNHE